jgi:hypothetical protein
MIRQRLEAAFADDEQQRVAAHADRLGLYLTFFSEPGFDLVLKSLETRRLGIRLLNARTEQENLDQTAWVADLLHRVDMQVHDQVVVLVRDHGVNNGHRLLQPLLPDWNRIPPEAEAWLTAATASRRGNTARRHRWYWSHSGAGSRVVGGSS